MYIQLKHELILKSTYKLLVYKYLQMQLTAYKVWRAVQEPHINIPSHNILPYLFLNTSNWKFTNVPIYASHTLFFAGS